MSPLEPSRKEPIWLETLNDPVKRKLSLLMTKIEFQVVHLTLFPLDSGSASHGIELFFSTIDPTRKYPPQDFDLSASSEHVGKTIILPIANFEFHPGLCFEKGSPVQHLLLNALFHSTTRADSRRNYQ